MIKNAASIKTFGRCDNLGIDVSKATLEVVGLAKADVWKRTIDNQLREIERLAQALIKAGYVGKIVCESTGHYHLLLALVFARYGLDLRIVNPLQSSKHQTARIRKTKTDPVDGYVLATMCETERDLPKAAHLQSNQVLARLRQGQLQSLGKQIQRLDRSLATYRETYEKLELEGGQAIEMIDAGLVQLQRAKKQLEAELESAYLELAETEDVAQLRVVPGYSDLMSSMVAGVFDRDVKSDRSWVAFAGLDVSVRESGTWKGRGKLTKRGNSFIRKRLFNAAWGAKMNYPEVRRYYEQLRSQGRHYVEALCIIAKKLLRIAYAILVNGKTYDPKIAFPG
jgi:transposase